jgi:hypothetical protein
MKIPRLTAELSIGAAAGVYRGEPRAGAQALVPMATLACLSDCVGPDTAAHCSAECATASDLQACFQQCAKPVDTACVEDCFTS